MENDFDKFAEIRDGKVMLKPFRDYPEREIGEVKEDEASTKEFYTQKFEDFRSKVVNLENQIHHSDNKGSFLMKLLHLKEQVGVHKGVGDYEALLKKIDDLEQYLRTTIEENRQKNYTIKSRLLEEAEQLKDSRDWEETTEKLKELRQKWIKTGRVPEDKEQEMEERFQNAVNQFFSNKKAFYKEKQELIEDRIKTYEQIIEEARALAEGEAEYVDSGKLDALHEKWKNVGKVPHKKNKELWNNFKHYTDKIAKQTKKPDKKTGGQNEKEGIAAKEEICKEAEKVASENPEDLEKVKVLQEKWKQSPNVSGKKIKEIRERFNRACDYVYENNFISQLIAKKYPDFSQKSPQEQLRIKRRLLKDLIDKNQNDIELYQENSEKMNVKESNFNKMVQSKIENRKRKLEVKKVLMQEIENAIESSS